MDAKPLPPEPEIKPKPQPEPVKEPEPPVVSAPKANWLSAKLAGLFKYLASLFERPDAPLPTVPAEPAQPVEPKKEEPKQEVRPHVVEFKNVSKTYEGKKPYTAIENVSFLVEDIPNAGELIAVLGPSGCGKSTILKLIAGLGPQHPATKGEVLVFGKPVTGPGSDRGMVFQEYTAFDNRTVLENVAFGLECDGYPKELRREMARHWIEKVGLNAVKDADKYPHQLSGGMRQRVAIARSLVLKPKILLMDEPFGALDPMTRLRMQDVLIKLWSDTETTVFFVTHDISEAVFIGDRIYMLSNAPGTIIEEIHAPRPVASAIDTRDSLEFQDKVKHIRTKIIEMEKARGII